MFYLLFKLSCRFWFVSYQWCNFPSVPVWKLISCVRVKHQGRQCCVQPRSKNPPHKSHQSGQSYCVHTLRLSQRYICFTKFLFFLLFFFCALPLLASNHSCVFKFMSQQFYFQVAGFHLFLILLWLYFKLSFIFCLALPPHCLPVQTCYDVLSSCCLLYTVSMFTFSPNLYNFKVLS